MTITGTNTTDPSASMTMAFAFRSSAGIMLGWGLTWAAAELNMLQRLLSTVSLTDPQWVLVLALSVVAPLVVGVDNAVRIRRLRESEPAGDSGASTVGSGV